MHILVVDDHRDAASSLAELLRALVEEHVSTTVAFDGEHAVKAADAFRPDIVFLDIAMPGMDGLMAAHRIRQLYGRRVAIAALSGQDEHVAAARDSGDFDDAFRKPVSADELLQFVRAASALERQTIKRW